MVTAAQLGLTVAPEVRTAMEAMAASIEIVSAERVRFPDLTGKPVAVRAKVDFDNP